MFFETDISFFPFLGVAFFIRRGPFLRLKPHSDQPKRPLRDPIGNAQESIDRPSFGCHRLSLCPWRRRPHRLAGCSVSS